MIKCLYCNGTGMWQHTLTCCAASPLWGKSHGTDDPFVLVIPLSVSWWSHMTLPYSEGILNVWERVPGGCFGELNLLLINQCILILEALLLAEAPKVASHLLIRGSVVRSSAPPVWEFVWKCLWKILNPNCSRRLLHRCVKECVWVSDKQLGCS